MSNNSILVSRESAADALSISTVTLDRIVQRGEISAVKLGRRVLFTRSALNAYVKRLQKATL